MLAYGDVRSWGPKRRLLRRGDTSAIGVPAQVVDATQALNRSGQIAGSAWSFVGLPSHFVELGLRVHGQVSHARNDAIDLFPTFLLAK